MKRELFFDSINMDYFVTLDLSYREVWKLYFDEINQIEVDLDDLLSESHALLDVEEQMNIKIAEATQRCDDLVNLMDELKKGYHGLDLQSLNASEKKKNLNVILQDIEYVSEELSLMMNAISQMSDKIDVMLSIQDEVSREMILNCIAGFIACPQPLIQRGYAPFFVEDFFIMFNNVAQEVMAEETDTQEKMINSTYFINRVIDILSNALEYLDAEYRKMLMNHVVTLFKQITQEQRHLERADEHVVEEKLESLKLSEISMFKRVIPHSSTYTLEDSSLHNSFLNTEK